jgi:hypothetical protein
MDIPAIGFEKVRLENELGILSSRREQRIEIESTLEKLLHQWWEATGSDRSGPLATPSILMSEARAVLRNKDTRRQKIQKLIKDIGSKSKDEQISFYYSKKKQELIQNLKSVSDEFKITKPLDLEGVSLLINLLDELSMISKMNQDLVLNAASKGDIWSSNATSMIRVFQLLETSESSIEAERQVTQLVKDCPFEGDTSVTFFLTVNSHLTETLYGQGLGRAFLSDRVERSYETGSTGLFIEPPNIQLLPKVQGASKVPLSENSRLLFEKNSPLEPKMTPRASNQFGDQVKKPKVTGAQPEDSMSARARAVLDLLNPKSKDKIR